MCARIRRESIDPIKALRVNPEMPSRSNRRKLRQFFRALRLNRDLWS